MKKQISEFRRSVNKQNLKTIGQYTVLTVSLVFLSNEAYAMDITLFATGMITPLVALVKTYGTPLLGVIGAGTVILTFGGDLRERVIRGAIGLGLGCGLMQGIKLMLNT